MLRIYFSGIDKNSLSDGDDVIFPSAFFDRESCRSFGITNGRLNLDMLQYIILPLKFCAKNLNCLKPPNF